MLRYLNYSTDMQILMTVGAIELNSTLAFTGLTHRAYPKPTLFPQIHSLSILVSSIHSSSSSHQSTVESQTQVHSMLQVSILRQRKSEDFRSVVVLYFVNYCPVPISKRRPYFMSLAKLNGDLCDNAADLLHCHRFQERRISLLYK